MPFIAQNQWMQNIGRIWVWIVLTFPSTVLAVLFYVFFTRRGMTRPRGPHTRTDEEEMNALDSEDEI